MIYNKEKMTFIKTAGETERCNEGCKIVNSKNSNEILQSGYLKKSNVVWYLPWDLIVGYIPEVNKKQYHI